LGLCEKTRKCIELLFPELPVMLDPFGRVLHGFGGQAAAINSSVFPPRDKLCPLEHPQVLGHARERYFVGRGQIADGGFALRQPRQDAAPGGVGKRRKCGVELGPGILNHVV
jgi:hypothetical protein